MHRLKFFALAAGCFLAIGLTIASLADWSFFPVDTTEHSDTLPVLSSSASSVSSSRSSLSGAIKLTPAAKGAAYSDYTPRSLQSGKRAVLFFAQSGDPFSLSHDTLIRSLAASGMLKVPTYRVDFGSATGARFTFAVIAPDTFVTLDATGQRVLSLIHPDTDQLTTLLTTPSPL